MSRISLVICTLNRARSLLATLHSVEAAVACDGDIEVVLADNGSVDHTPAVIDEWAATVPFPVKYLLVSRKGLSAARNAAISAATGNLLVFTDDDCHLEEDFFTALRRHYAGDQEPVMRGGRVELGDPADLPFTIKTDAQAERMNDVHFPGGFIIGANMAIPRAIIDRVGLFDERFGAGAHLKAAEDTDYIYRVYRAGYAVEYQPDMVVQHFHGRKDRNSIAKLHAQYNIGNGALYAKHCTDWRLLRHFYWDFRKMIRGINPHDGLALSARAVIVGNVRGMLRYACLVARIKIVSVPERLRFLKAGPISQGAIIARYPDRPIIQLPQSIHFQDVAPL